MLEINVKRSRPAPREVKAIHFGETLTFAAGFSFPFPIRLSFVFAALNLLFHFCVLLLPRDAPHETRDNVGANINAVCQHAGRKKNQSENVFLSTFGRGPDKCTEKKSRKLSIIAILFLLY